MPDTLKVAVDAMGGDYAPKEIVKGAVEAVNEKDNIQVILVGPEDIISEELKAYDYAKERITIVDAKEVISTEESPVSAIRKKKDSSIVVGDNLVKKKEADAFISAGSTGAVLAGGTLIVGRISGVERPPLGTVLPSTNGAFMLLDSGANVDTRPSHLVQFAQMGSLYMEHVVGINNPRVAIVNVGIEEEKGNTLVKETYGLLKELDNINFIGNIEAREIPQGGADVVVCDGFCGNVILKLYEGTAMSLVEMIKKGLMSTTRSKIGGALIKPALKETLKLFDAGEYGGAPLLGLKGLVVKTHGNSTSKAIKSAIYQCQAFKEENINARYEECFSK